MNTIEIECTCGMTVPVEDIETTLHDEDCTPVDVTCSCGERYRVSLSLSILGKAAKPTEVIDIDELLWGGPGGAS